MKVTSNISPFPKQKNAVFNDRRYLDKNARPIGTNQSIY